MGYFTIGETGDQPRTSHGENKVRDRAFRCTRLFDDTGTILFSCYRERFTSGRSPNPALSQSICVGKTAPPFSAYKVNGWVTIHENDPIAADLDESVRTGHGKEFKPRREKLAAVYFTVEEIYDQTLVLKSAGRRIS